MLEFLPFLLTAGVLGGLIYYFLIKKKTSAPVPAPVPAASTGWNILYSTGMPPSFAQTFTFPNPPNSVHYVVIPGSLTPGRSNVTLAYQIDGTGTLRSTQDGGPGQITMFLQRNGDDLSGVGPYASYRFWAQGASQVLAPGVSIISVPLTADQWTNVFGQNDNEGFQAVLADLAYIGFTFGNPGAGATGHGVDTDGNMTFTVVNFSVI